MRREPLLLIEVDPPTASWYELFLSARGFEVDHAPSANLALRSAVTTPPRVVIIGRLADGTDAGTVAERLRALGASPRPIIVAMSDRIGELEAADVVIPVGANPRAVLDAIRTATRSRSRDDVQTLVP
jgi:DNA-binding response OmpR family regulator